jgi:hypothetical protein
MIRCLDSLSDIFEEEQSNESAAKNTARCYAAGRKGKCRSREAAERRENLEAVMQKLVVFLSISTNLGDPNDEGTVKETYGD